MTGFSNINKVFGIVQPDSLESRTLEERFKRHRAIMDMFKSKDSDEEEFEEMQKKKLSKIDRELKDASVAAH